jgi:hypothetical protein
MATRDTHTNDVDDPLGIAHEPIARTPEDHLEGGDRTSRRRRARALGEDGIEHPTDGLGDMNIDPDGAAGIDMGYGGESTDIKPSGSSKR